MKVGFTCSAFDFFHAGHVLMLEEAKTQCDYLIVGLHVDPSKERDTKTKPYQSLYERFVQVEACKYVDRIIPYETEEELMNILASQKIDVRIIGEEYQGKDFTGSALPMEIYFNKRRHNMSSTKARHQYDNRKKTVGVDAKAASH